MTTIRNTTLIVSALALSIGGAQAMPFSANLAGAGRSIVQVQCAEVGRYVVCSRDGLERKLRNLAAAAAKSRWEGRVRRKHEQARLGQARQDAFNLGQRWERTKPIRRERAMQRQQNEDPVCKAHDLCND